MFDMYEKDLPSFIASEPITEILNANIRDLSGTQFEVFPNRMHRVCFDPGISQSRMYANEDVGVWYNKFGQLVSLMDIDILYSAKNNNCLPVLFPIPESTIVDITQMGSGRIETSVIKASAGDTCDCARTLRRLKGLFQGVVIVSSVSRLQCSNFSILHITYLVLFTSALGIFTQVEPSTSVTLQIYSTYSGYSSTTLYVMWNRGCNRQQRQPGSTTFAQWEVLFPRLILVISLGVCPRYFISSAIITTGKSYSGLTTAEFYFAFLQKKTITVIFSHDHTSITMGVSLIFTHRKRKICRKHRCSELVSPWFIFDKKLEFFEMLYNAYEEKTFSGQSETRLGVCYLGFHAFQSQFDHDASQQINVLSTQTTTNFRVLLLLYAQLAVLNIQPLFTMAITIKAIQHRRGVIATSIISVYMLEWNNSNSIIMDVTKIVPIISPIRSIHAVSKCGNIFFLYTGSQVNSLHSTVNRRPWIVFRGIICCKNGTYASSLQHQKPIQGQVHVRLQHCWEHGLVELVGAGIISGKALTASPHAQIQANRSLTCVLHPVTSPILGPIKGVLSPYIFYRHIFGYISAICLPNTPLVYPNGWLNFELLYVFSDRHVSVKVHIGSDGCTGLNKSALLSVCCAKEMSTMRDLEETWSVGARSSRFCKFDVAVSSSQIPILLSTIYRSLWQVFQGVAAIIHCSYYFKYRGPSCYLLLRDILVGLPLYDLSSGHIMELHLPALLHVPWISFIRVICDLEQFQGWLPPVSYAYSAVSIIAQRLKMQFPCAYNSATFLLREFFFSVERLVSSVHIHPSDTSHSENNEVTMAILWAVISEQLSSCQAMIFTSFAEHAVVPLKDILHQCECSPLHMYYLQAWLLHLRPPNTEVALSVILLYIVSEQWVLSKTSLDVCWLKFWVLVYGLTRTVLVLGMLKRKAKDDPMVLALLLDILEGTVRAAQNSVDSMMIDKQYVGAAEHLIAWTNTNFKSFLSIIVILLGIICLCRHNYQSFDLEDEFALKGEGL